MKRVAKSVVEEGEEWNLQGHGNGGVQQGKEEQWVLEKGKEWVGCYCVSQRYPSQRWNQPSERNLLHLFGVSSCSTPSPSSWVPFSSRLASSPWLWKSSNTTRERRKVTQEEKKELYEGEKKTRHTHTSVFLRCRSWAWASLWAFLVGKTLIN